MDDSVDAERDAVRRVLEWRRDRLRLLVCFLDEAEQLPLEDNMFWCENNARNKQRNNLCFLSDRLSLFQSLCTETGRLQDENDINLSKSHI
eukprot:scaffold288_cov143-Ochromonas_danica.AAC.7